MGNVSPGRPRFLLALPKGGNHQEFTVVTNWDGPLQKDLLVYTRSNSNTVISGGAPIRIGAAMVPMPRFT
jgi:hypothetical protein